MLARAAPCGRSRGLVPPGRPSPDRTQHRQIALRATVIVASQAGKRSVMTEDLRPVPWYKFGTNHYPTPTTLPNINRHLHRPPVVLNIEVLARVLPSALHQQTQPGPHKTCPRREAGLRDGRHKRQARFGGGVAGCGIPPTSPRATTGLPGGKPGMVDRRLAGMLPPGTPVGGVCPAEGIPHDSQCSRSSMVARHRKGATISDGRRLINSGAPWGPPTLGRGENPRELLSCVSASQCGFSSPIAWSARTP
jgi:hypothetical protein